MKHANPKYEHIQDPSGTIPQDEPVFLLRGTDPATPAAIETWAVINQHLGAPTARICESLRHSERIRKYQEIYPELVHVPGTPYPLKVREP
jgi:hypothetical protein